MRKRLGLLIMTVFTIVGGAGCMSSESKVIEHLEEKYNEKFEVESTKEGSVIFPKMYGKDKVIAHPEGKPELVFLAGESRNKEGVYYDTYVLSSWSKELDEKYKDQIIRDFGPDAKFKTLLMAEEEKYNASMLDMPFTEYVSDVNNNVDITVKIAIKTAGEPDINQYLEPIYNLLATLKEENSELYGVSIGFVDASEDISNYVRTSNINNIPWSNLDAKVYGTIMVDNFMEIKNPGELAQHYKTAEG